MKGLNPTAIEFHAIEGSAGLALRYARFDENDERIEQLIADIENRIMAVRRRRSGVSS